MSLTDGDILSIAEAYTSESRWPAFPYPRPTPILYTQPYLHRAQAVSLGREAYYYANRLAKQSIVRSQETNNEWATLVHFIPRHVAPLPELVDIQHKNERKVAEGRRMEIEGVDHLQDLNKEGLRIIDKLQKILTRRDLLNFLNS